RGAFTCRNRVFAGGGPNAFPWLGKVPRESGADEVEAAPSLRAPKKAQRGQPSPHQSPAATASPPEGKPLVPQAFPWQGKVPRESGADEVEAVPPHRAFRLCRPPVCGVDIFNQP